MEVEWDPEKAAENLRHHGVAFEEGATVFGDPMAKTIPDPDHSIEEDRELTIGHSASGQTLVVWHTDRGQAIRIIGVRRAEPAERRKYESEE